MLYHGAKGARSAYKAFSDGDPVGMLKSLAKVTTIRKLLGGGVSSVLDGLGDAGEDEKPKKGR